MKIGNGEVIDQKPVALGSDIVEVQLSNDNLAPTRIQMHKDIAERNTSSKTFAFGDLGFETEADRRRKALGQNP